MLNLSEGYYIKSNITLVFIKLTEYIYHIGTHILICVTKLEVLNTFHSLITNAMAIITKGHYIINYIHTFMNVIYYYTSIVKI